MAKRKTIKLTEDEYEYLCACETDYKEIHREAIEWKEYAGTLNDDKEILIEEIQGLKKENEILSASNKTLALTRGRIEAEINKAKQKAYKEVLADIDAEAYKNEYGDMYLDRADFNKIKKKYRLNKGV